MAQLHTSRFSRFMSLARLIVLAVIAIVLVKFAFFPPSDQADGAPLDPTFDIPQMTTMPQTASISNAIDLKGTIQADPGVDAKSPSDGVVDTIFVDDGVKVEAGQDLVELKLEMPGEDREITDDEGNVTIISGEPWYKYVRVKAPVAGEVHMDVMRGQSFVIGDVVGKISPGTFSAFSSMGPEQMYRLTDLPSTATITIKDGPAPFECTDVTVQTARTDKPEDEAGTSSLGVTCKIPADQKVFAGLATTMTISGGEATDVLALPITAVDGRVGDGFVYLPTDDPENPKKHPVKLGLTDGVMIEIKEGLTADQEVLEFTPLARDEDQCDPMTGEGC